MRLLIGGLVLGTLIWATRKASISTSLTVEPEGIRFTDISITRLTGAVKYRLTNTGTASVTVSNFFGIVNYKGAKLAEISKADSFTIPPRGHVNISIDFRVGVLSSLTQAVAFIKSALEAKKFTGITVQIIGGFDANRVPIPFDYPFTIIQ